MTLAVKNIKLRHVMPVQERFCTPQRWHETGRAVESSGVEPIPRVQMKTVLRFSLLGALLLGGHAFAAEPKNLISACSPPPK